MECRRELLLPEKLSEEQHKKKQKIKINNLLRDAHQQTLEWKKGEFIVDGVQYKPKVSKPLNAEILVMEDSQIKQVLVHQGDQTQSMRALLQLLQQKCTLFRMSL